ncbi:MAG TPA: NAD(P)-dependent oxidoreductase [Steroidobacteraceae bacterium]|nr:NAD(P)-dependent oxidoreductase [Steroidobacteraceae bacterium]
MNLQDCHLLVTGASGFIGSRLALHLSRSGIDAVFTGRDANDIEQARIRELAAAGVKVQLGDLREAEFVAKVMAGRNSVIHLAAAQHESHMSDEHFRSVNVAATRLLLEAARVAGVRRFVYGSTMGIHGSSEKGPITEDSAPKPLNIYTQTKLAAEGVVGEFASQIDVVITRIAETYGPGDLRLLKLFKAIDRDRFVMIGRGDNERQPIYVDDLIRGLLAALVRPTAIGETILLTGNEVMTTRDMVRYIATVLDKPMPRLHLPMWPVLAAANVSYALLRPLQIHSPLQPRSLDFFRKSFVFSTTKARDLLGVEPSTRFVDGARATLDWYRTQGYMPDGAQTLSSSTAHV